MKTKKWQNRWPAVLFVWLVFMGCAGRKIHVHMQPAEKAPREDVFTAGAAKVDITPPPGYPMGGFSIAGKFSRGWWTRLYAKSIYLQDRDGNRLVLVSADLWSFPAGLGDKICEKIAEKKPDLGLGREQIIFAATHTHHSPGNYSSSAAYNMLGSPDAGFNEALFNMLVDRISDVIIRSHKHRKQAGITLHQVQLPGISRNRSYEAYARNPEKDLLLLPPETVEAYFTSDLPAYVNSLKHLQAVDPTLTVLKITGYDKPKPYPLALTAFISVHPTAMGTKTEVYSGDIFAVAAHLVEQKLSRHNTMVAVFNGAFGDILSNWNKQDRRNTLRLGEQLAIGIGDARKSSGIVIEGEIANTYNCIVYENRLIRQDFIEQADAFCQPNPEPKTDRSSLPGVAALGGAENGRTVFFDFGFREGVIDERCNDRQGAKMFTGKKVLRDFLRLDTKKPLGKAINKWIKHFLKSSGPPTIPLAVNTLGSIKFVALPGEFTFTLGKRLKDKMKEEHPDIKEVLLIGPANEYLSYFTTPSEYNAQHYEGAMTLSGQFAGTYVKQELVRLARLPNGSASYDLTPTYKVGNDVYKKKFGRITEGDGWCFEEAIQNILLDNSTGAVHVRFPQAAWDDKIIYLSEKTETAGRMVNPVVSVEKRDNQNTYSHVEADTSSLNFVCLIHSVTGDTAHWRAIYMPCAEPDSTQAFRFKVDLPSGDTLYSAGFCLKDYAPDIPVPPPVEARMP